jgi:hypothetical protein
MIRPNDRWAVKKNEKCHLPEATPRNLVVTYVSEKPAAFTFSVYSYQTIRRHIQGDSHVVSRYLPLVGKHVTKYECWLVSLRPSIWKRDLPNMMQEYWRLRDRGFRWPHKRHPQTSACLYFSFNMTDQVLYPYKTCPEDQSKNRCREMSCGSWRCVDRCTHTYTHTHTHTHTHTYTYIHTYIQSIYIYLFIFIYM